jgi:hypothetical protein
VKQTEAVVQYLSIARMHEHSTRLEIPKIKHAPTSLAASLEEYLNDKDFEINRRQYLAEREAKRSGGKSTNGASKPLSDSKTGPSKAAASTSRPATATAPPPKPAASAPLIDLFESIQDNQQTMAQPQVQPQVQQFPQQTGFQQQPSFQVPQQPTAMGFPQQQQSFSPPQQQQAFSPPQGQGTNPFAQMQPQQQQQPLVQTQFTGAGFGGYTPQPFNTQNSTLSPIAQNGMSFFSSQPQPQQNIPTIAESLQPQQTSTNPFRQSMMPSTSLGPAEPKMLNNPTGVSTSLSRSPTNPFAKHNTGFQQQSQSPVSAMSSSPFSSLPPIQEPQSSSPFAQQSPPQQQTLPSAPTGTNPFARNTSPSQGGLSPQGGLTVHPTGSTNPFRQSAFVNQQTGQGWQHSASQGTLGGMSVDQVPTTNIFPRPGQQQTGNYMG